MTSRAPDIVANVNEHPVAYWEANPDVMQAEMERFTPKGRTAYYQLSLWLTEAAHRRPDPNFLDQFGPKAPDRPRDIELFCEGEPKTEIVERCPNLECVRFFRSEGDE